MRKKKKPKKDGIMNTTLEIKSELIDGPTKNIKKVWKRKCFVCNEEKEYKSWASSKRNTPCRKCTTTLQRGILRKSKLPVLCKGCNKIRFYTVNINLKTSSENNSLCKSCAQKGRIGNRKGGTMPVSAKVLLSQKLSGKNHPQYGKPISSNTKRKLRLLAIDRIKKLNGSVLPNYNPIACNYFNKLNEIEGCKIRHAENGGEYYLDKLGYWLDGYDKENNVVYEWYEKHHFNPDGSIRKKDLDRKNEIIKSLQCSFVGYDYTGKKIINESSIIPSKISDR